MITQLLKQQAEALQRKGLYRSRLLITDEITLNFSSNDYLSLRQDARVQRAYQRGFSRYDAGSGASMLVCGYQPIHQTLERVMAERLGVDKALLFSSGYAANLGIIAMLASLPCHFLVDKGVHASVYDGLTLADAQYTRYAHLNRDDLERKIATQDSRQVLVTEGIFSMSGQQPDLREISDLCVRHQTACVVDEAHAFGVIGPQGFGAVAHYGLTQDEVPLRMIAFGKAMGGQGAIVAGKADWVDALCQSARSAIYSTAISPALTYGLLETFDLLCEAQEARQKLTSLIGYFQTAIRNSPLRWRASITPIQQLQLGCPHQAQDLAVELRRQGIVCQAMREPTVTRADTGLRVVLNARHTPEDIDRLFAQLSDYFEAVK
jgi:8-amino-7-oxononanoate synthase